MQLNRKTENENQNFFFSTQLKCGINWNTNVT